MSHIASTIWPATPVPEHARMLINNFLDILDHNTEDAGEKLVKYIFTADAEFHSSGGVARGHKEIRASRTAAWKIVKYRRHDVVKVYSATDDASDLMWIGDAVLILKNDKEVKGAFLARIVLEDVNSKDVRIKYFQVWGDSGPMMKVLQEHPITE
ncbi:hypothetical protein OIDMADRAFT_53039 [Oidiodendron maius Zn]|uniref:SnoaL-like domain-containing protein n=1 Tax=Oidiodendron maius (strain Zn) TaxID=913774 RepID=A0A0C3DMK7_OIDMZ|nr:hypothetical protein OIDMADRAFT_53039 [Oidiodendron maius Zn]